MQAALWLATALLTGCVLMSLEMAAFRLFAPYFGYSIYVWGCMISFVMAAMALGYFLGGWAADRSRDDTPLYLAILFSAVYQAGVLYGASRILPAFAQLGEFSGTALATLVVFCVPVISLSGAGPFVVRLLARSGRVGSMAGSVSALSTAGSIAGVLITTYLLIPRFGTRATLQALCVLTALLAACGLWNGRNRRAVATLAPLAGLLLLAPTGIWRHHAVWPPQTQLVWLAESTYNLIRVLRVGRWHVLTLNDSRIAQTVRHDSSPLTRRYHDTFALGPLMVPARTMLVLGMGAGASIAAARQTAPHLEVDAVEIDDRVVEAGVRYFGLRRDDPRLRIHVQDARRWLARSRGSWDIIQLDLYEGGPYIPFYLTTVEFFQLVAARLARGGIVMNNVFDAGREREILHSTLATMAEVFPALLVDSDPSGSHMIFAFPFPVRREDMAAKLSGAAAGAAGEAAARVASRLAVLRPPPGAIVFTDDHAPVEPMIRGMIQAYLAAPPLPRRKR